MEGLAVVTQAIDYIEHNLSQKLDLKTVAEVVHYSGYHLHRTFTHVVGMSLHDYVLRRRLTDAAKLLTFSDLPILHIALFAGYQSQQAFTDAFTAMYKTSPHQFRRNEVFYPLQLAFEFGGMPVITGKEPKEIVLATAADIPRWMDLVRLAVDGFPHLSEEDYRSELAQRINERSAFLMKGSACAIAAMLISQRAGSIDFLAVHPLYRGQGVIRNMVERALTELNNHSVIITTTFREGDRADTGHRQALLSLGFTEAERLTEFGYPTQKLILSGEKSDV